MARGRNHAFWMADVDCIRMQMFTTGVTFSVTLDIREVRPQSHVL